MNEVADLGAPRLARLEREVAFHRGLALVALVVAVLALLLAVRRETQRQVKTGTIEAERFVLRDRRGVQQGEWTTAGGSPELVVGIQAAGQPRIGIGPRGGIGLQDGRGLGLEMRPAEIVMYGGDVGSTTMLRGCLVARAAKGDYVFPDPSQVRPADPKKLEEQVARARKPSRGYSTL